MPPRRHRPPQVRGQGARWVAQRLGNPFSDAPPKPTPATVRYRCPVSPPGYTTHLVAHDPDDPNITIWLRSKERSPSRTNTYVWAKIGPDPSGLSYSLLEFIGPRWGSPFSAAIWAHEQGYVTHWPTQALVPPQATP